jgi:integrase
MTSNHAKIRGKQAKKRSNSSNVKKSKKYERFGDHIRYFTMDEWKLFISNIDNHEHKLVMLLIYETGCRVGEFVQIKLKHFDFLNSSILFPAENTKTKHQRTSFIPKGLLNDIIIFLRSQNRMAKRSQNISKSEDYLFRPQNKKNKNYTPNRIRQIFQQYVIKAGLHREYGEDQMGRKLHKFTIHTLRHSHCMHYIHIYKLPVPIVQKQVGHTTLDATMTYCRPTDEFVGQSYQEARINSGINPTMTRSSQHFKQYQ